MLQQQYSSDSFSSDSKISTYSKISFSTESKTYFIVNLRVKFEFIFFFNFCILSGQKHLFNKMSRITNLFESNLMPMESDAFIIELLALDSHYDERLAYILLEASFECYQNLNYCLIAVPSCTRYFPLLRHFVVRAGIHINWMFSYFKFYEFRK